jgi:type II secretory pathway predicted ATPase ExeA
LLANIETNQEKLLNLVMAGQPELSSRLNDPSLRQLKQRVALRCELRPLTATETATYVTGRIRKAGGEGPKAFTADAVGLIHERARGLPRAVNVIADNALVGGFAANEKPVTRRIVGDVCRDFDLGASFEAPDRPVRQQIGHAVSERPELFAAATPRRRFSLFGR